MTGFPVEINAKQSQALVNLGKTIYKNAEKSQPGELITTFLHGVQEAGHDLGAIWHGVPADAYTAKGGTKALAAKVEKTNLVQIAKPVTEPGGKVVTNPDEQAVGALEGTVFETVPPNVPLGQADELHVLNFTLSPDGDFLGAAYDVHQLNQGPSGNGLTNKSSFADIQKATTSKLSSSVNANTAPWGEDQVTQANIGVLSVIKDGTVIGKNPKPHALHQQVGVDYKPGEDYGYDDGFLTHSHTSSPMDGTEPQTQESTYNPFMLDRNENLYVGAAEERVPIEEMSPVSEEHEFPTPIQQRTGSIPAFQPQPPFQPLETTHTGSVPAFQPQPPLQPDQVETLSTKQRRVAARHVVAPTQQLSLTTEIGAGASPNQPPPPATTTVVPKKSGFTRAKTNLNQ